MTASNATELRPWTWVPATVLALASACASVRETPLNSPASTAPLTPVEVNSLGVEDDQKRIEVTGWLFLHPEAQCLLQNKHDPERGAARQESLTVVADRALATKVRSLNGRKVVARGIFQKNILGPDTIVVGACNTTAIAIEGIEPVE